MVKDRRVVDKLRTPKERKKSAVKCQGRIIVHQRYFSLLRSAEVFWILPALAAVGLCSCSRAGNGVSAHSPAVAAVASRSSSKNVAPEPTIGVAARMKDISPRALPNFSMVHPFLLRGAAPTPEGIKELKGMGVRTIIDLRIAPKTVAAEKRQVESLGMQFINLPMSGDPPTAKQVRTFLTSTSNPSQQPVFVHCQHGADRTGTMVGIYREQVDHWTFDHTFQEMRRYGFNPHWRKLTATVQQYATVH